MTDFPDEFEYSEEDKTALRLSITNYLKGSDLYTLRRFALECGVNSPTTKGKNEAIEASIRAILREGDSEKHSNRGAPMKADAEAEIKVASLIDGVKGLIYGYFEKKNADKKKERFSLSDDHGDQAFIGLYAPEASGGSIRKNLFVFNPSTDVIVDEQQSYLFPFKAGDQIECISELQPYGPRRLKRVISVNSMSIDRDFKYVGRFDGIAPVFPDKVLSLNGGRAFGLINSLCPILYGQRVLIVSPCEAELNDLFIALSSAEDCFPVLIGQGGDDAAYCMERINNCVVCSLDAEGSSKASLALERAKRLAEAGKNAVLIINDLNSLLFSYGARLHPERSFGGNSYAAIIEATKLFNGARALSTGGSLTVIAIVRESLYPAISAETAHFLRLAECRLFATKAEADGLPFFDFARSISKKGEEALSSAEKERNKAIRAKNPSAEAFIPMGDETAADILKRLS